MKIFLVLIAIVILIFIIGIVMFIIQYRKRRLVYELEKTRTEKQHKLDLLNNQLLVQQQTMQFIGSEIHDSVAQKLTLASIYSQKLEHDNPHSDVMPSLKKIITILNDSLAELRDLAKTLTNDIHNEPLAELIHREEARVNDSGIYIMKVKCDFNRPICVTTKSFLLRVIQEFVQNSLKHSGGNTIEISMVENGNGLYMEISDNGKGFDTENNFSNGIGLSNMRRRIQMIGGQFDLKSKIGEGTLLTIFIENKNLIPG